MLTNRGEIIALVEKSQLKTDLPRISVGDNVDVHVKIVEGEKSRIQIFSGVVMRLSGRGTTRAMTVRRIVANEGVERTFMVHSPRVAKIEILRHGHTRRAKLNFLRERVGKSRRLPDRRRHTKHLPVVDGSKRANDGVDEAAAAAPAQA